MSIRRLNGERVNGHGVNTGVHRGGCPMMKLRPMSKAAPHHGLRPRALRPVWRRAALKMPLALLLIPFPALASLSASSQVTPPQPPIKQINSADSPLAQGEVDALRADLGREAEASARHAALVSLARRTQSGASNPAAASLDETLVAALIATLEWAEPGDRVLAVRALTSTTSRDATRALIGMLAQEQTAQVQQEALAALSRQTGRSDLTGVAQWKAWWSKAQWLTEGEWRQRLAQSHAAHAAQLDLERRALLARLVELHRRLFSATPVAARSALLATMMADEEPQIRALAFEFAEREMLNARQLDVEVKSEAVSRLTDQDPRIREAAAHLLGKLNANDDAVAMAHALAAEQDPKVAAALLTAVSHHPTDDDVESALRWLSKPTVASASSALLLKAIDANLMLNPSRRLRALQLLRAAQTSALSVEQIRLLASLGDASDRVHLRTLFGDENKAKKLAAAESLARWSSELESLLSTAESDSDLFPAAMAGLIEHRPTSDAATRANRLPASSSDVKMAWMERLARAMPPGELLKTAIQADTPATRLVLLRHVQARRDQSKPKPRHLSMIEARLLLLLAGSQLDLGDASGSLETITSLDEMVATFPALLKRAQRLRILALVALNRLDEAEQLQAPVSVWLDALEDAIGRSDEHAKDLRDAIASRFSPTMAKQDQARLHALTERLDSSAANAGGGHDNTRESGKDTETGKTTNDQHASTVSD